MSNEEISNIEREQLLRAALIPTFIWKTYSIISVNDNIER